MPNYQKLVRGGLDALARAQEELHPAESAEALRARLAEALKSAQLEAYGHPAAASAQDIYAGQHLGGLQLYHGSPHLFTPTEANPLGQFDTLSFMGSGEGAQAFGPGTYLSGNIPLAEHYAATLARKRQGSFPSSWAAGYAHDPHGFLEFLRARALSKGLKYGLDPDKPGRVRTPALWSERPDSARFPTYDYSWEPELLRPAGIARVDLNNAGAYLEAMRRTDGPNTSNLHGWVRSKLRTPDSGKVAADIGRSLLDKGALSEGHPLVKQTKLEGVTVPELPWNKDNYPTYKAWEDEKQRLTDEVLEKTGLGASARALGQADVDVTRNQLRAVRAATGGHEGNRAPPKYRVNMSNTLDLSKMSGQRVQPRVYAAETPVTPSELFSYSDPLKVNSPLVVSKLAALADAHKLTLSGSGDKFGTVSGDEFVTSLTRKLGKRGAMAALKEAGVPGLYFRRAGRRGVNASGDPVGREVFDPDDHNFVWFDDPLLNIKSRVDKRSGGAV